MVQDFIWNNGTTESPIVLTTEQINKLIAAGRNSAINANVKGVIKTQTGVYKYLKYALTQLYGSGLTILGEEVADSFELIAPTSTLLEGNSLTLDVSSPSGMQATDLKYKVIFGTITTDNVLDETGIKSRITVVNGVLRIAPPQENSTWSVPITVKACPLYEDIETTSNYVTTGSVLCKAIGMTGFSASAESEIAINSSTEVSYTTTPNNTTKLSNATITGSITQGEGTFTDGKFYASEATGINIVRIVCTLRGGASFTSTVNINVKNSSQSTITIWNGGKNGSISDTKSYVRGDVIANISTGEVTAKPDNVIWQIRQASHLYVGKYMGRDIGMKLKQLSDTDKTKYTDGTSAVFDPLTVTDKDVYLKLPTFYYKCVTNADDANKVDIIFSTGNDEEGTYTEWNTNTLIGVYKGAIIRNGAVLNPSSGTSYATGDYLRSVSGVKPTVNYSQDSFKKAARARNTTPVGSIPTDGFSIVTYEAHVVMAILYYAYYGGYDINCQNVIGSGTSTYPKTTGLNTDAMGMTDTFSSRLGGTGDSHSINFWGLENWWGDISEWMDNLITANNTGLINILNWSGNTVRQVQSSVQLSTGQCISKMVWNTQGGFTDLIPDELSGAGDYTKYYADYGSVVAGSGCVARRSYYGSSAIGGVGCLGLYGIPSSTDAGDGSRLVFSGRVTDITDTDEASSF